ncbi:MAG: hypothetical protein ABIK07_04970 [Planctomycetota bacterium]
MRRARVRFISGESINDCGFQHYKTRWFQTDFRAHAQNDFAMCRSEAVVFGHLCGIDAHKPPRNRHDLDINAHGRLPDRETLRK